MPVSSSKAKTNGLLPSFPLVSQKFDKLDRGSPEVVLPQLYQSIQVKSCIVPVFESSCLFMLLFCFEQSQ
jgi:hypothetical protein